MLKSTCGRGMVSRPQYLGDHMAKTGTRYRDSKTGLFVPEKVAVRRPATTEKETMKIGPVKKRTTK